MHLRRLELHSLSFFCDVYLYLLVLLDIVMRLMGDIKRNIEKF